MKIMAPFIPFLTLYYREIRRFIKVIVQTVLAPIVSSGLYLVIFGVSLGGSIQMDSGVTYLAFLIPGLVMMSVLNNAYQNSSSSIISGKFGGDLEDWKIVPLSTQNILWALALGGLTRGLLVGVITLTVGEIFYWFTYDQILLPAHPFYLFLFLTIGGLSFSMLGISIAFWAKTFEHISGVGSFVILPLIYLGGVFFTLKGLHPIWQSLSMANPLLYFINGVRYSMLGTSDVSVLNAFVVSAGSLIIFYVIALRVLKSAQYSRW